ncbi:MAG: endonuclease MutS2 [Spirochaetes bacterium]|nr:endonuclease MutS2 [Spirochaetota bacterium]
MSRTGKYSTGLVEFPKVCGIIAGYCIADSSKKLVRKTRPTANPGKLQFQFELLAELIRLSEQNVYVSIHRIHETKRLTVRACIQDNSLAVEEFVEIRENILSFINLKKDIDPYLGGSPRLAGLIGTVRIPHPVKEAIERVVDEHGSIRDEASPRLYDIVGSLRRVREDIDRILERYFTAPETKRFIQDRTITMKDDRYVIPIKSSFKGKIPGVVHAESGSGETLFIEPFSVTEKNNELKIFQKEKEREIRRILIELTKVVGVHAAEIDEVRDVLCEMDILLAKHRFMRERGGTIPELCSERMVRIKGGRHPLLTETPVPVDFEIGGENVGVVITGPNTGGKTVTLKLVGLCVLMAQSGFPVPADEMTTFLFDSLYADIGDEQSIEQSLSTFSGHIRNIKRIVDNAGERSLVLIDELGAGTDPVEGGAIGTAILDYLVTHRVLTVVTTHFSSVKLYALATEGVEVASVEFDAETCTPTYRLVMGVPGRSNAIQIAEHLGLNAGILDKTKEYISDKDHAYEGVYRKLSELELDLQQRLENASRSEEELSHLTRSYEEKLKDVEASERQIRVGYKKQLDDLIGDYRKRIERAVKRIREEGASKESIRSAKQMLQDAALEFETAKRPNIETEKKKGEKLFGTGDRVVVDHELGEKVEGTVVKVSGNAVTVQAGLFKLTVDKRRVYAADTDNEPVVEGGWNYEGGEPDGHLECDIRGKRYDEAMAELIRFLDNAVLRNATTVSVIHGLGTGALREGVWETLKNYRHAAGFEYARPENGGFGCTIVNLKK